MISFKNIHSRLIRDIYSRSNINSTKFLSSSVKPNPGPKNNHQKNINNKNNSNNNNTSSNNTSSNNFESNLNSLKNGPFDRKFNKGNTFNKPTTKENKQNNNKNSTNTAAAVANDILGSVASGSDAVVNIVETELQEDEIREMMSLDSQKLKSQIMNQKFKKHTLSQKYGEVYKQTSTTSTDKDVLFPPVTEETKSADSQYHDFLLNMFSNLAPNNASKSTEKSSRLSNNLEKKSENQTNNGSRSNFSSLNVSDLNLHNESQKYSSQSKKNKNEASASVSTSSSQNNKSKDINNNYNNNNYNNNNYNNNKLNNNNNNFNYKNSRDSDKNNSKNNYENNRENKYNKDKFNKDKNNEKEGLTEKETNFELNIMKNNTLLDKVSTANPLLSSISQLNSKPNKKKNALQQLKQSVPTIDIPEEGLSIRDFSIKLSLRTNLIIDKINSNQYVSNPTPDTILDADTMELIALDFDFEVNRLPATKKTVIPPLSVNFAYKKDMENYENFPPRPPVVSIMGHVDHGKTTLMDALRNVKDKQRVAGNEAGGITQKLTAFTINTKGKNPIVFVDTPGHAAFTTMRNQSASATDIVVLVVAIDDGVQPQTIEAINSAKNSNCSFIVALNKIDKFPDLAQREKAKNRVLRQLSSVGVQTEDFGGDSLVCEISGKTGAGIDDLLEKIQFQSDLLELRADNKCLAEGVVLDAGLEKGRGVVAEVLVKWGTLSVGQVVSIGTSYGKVKSMSNDVNKSVKSLTPSQSAKILGLKEVPLAGTTIIGVESEAVAREISEKRKRISDIKEERENKLIDLANKQFKSGNTTESEVTLEENIPEVAVVLKADSLGSLEALKNIVLNINDEVEGFCKLKLVSSKVGDVTTNDFEFASSSEDAVILGFNVRIADSNAQMAAKRFDIPVFRDTIIYRIEEDLIKKIEEYLPKIRSESYLGRAQVSKLFPLNTKVKSVVAGMKVVDGKMRTDDDTYFRIIRNGEVIHEDHSSKDSELRHLKDVVKEIDSGNDCGLNLNSYTEVSEGDIVECYQIKYEPRKINLSGSTRLDDSQIFGKFDN